MTSREKMPPLVKATHPMGSALSEAMQKAERAFLSRPTLSIRFRLIAGFVLCFLLAGTIALTTAFILYHVRSKLQFLEIATSMAYEVRQARRFEEGFFAGSGDVTEALGHGQNARALLDRARAGILEGAQETDLKAISLVLDRYIQLLAECRKLERSAGWTAENRQSLAEDLRVLGVRISGAAEALTSREWASVSGLIQASQIVPLVFLGALLVLIIFIVRFLAGAIHSPLKRFQGYSRRIAEGDFSPIMPARPFRDEFSDLALALNRMLIELQRHEEKSIQAAKMGAIGTLTSGVAHELNNPLNNIAISTEAMMEDYKSLGDDEKWKLLQDIYFETERASEIVKNLLDFTRQEKTQMVALDLQELLQSTLRLAQNEMSLHNITPALDIPPDLPRVMGAANQLKQVFLNLLLNAIQAMPQGGELTVRAFPCDAGQVCLEVRDQGEGIPPEDLPRIFEPFFTTKEPGKGTGLGLSVIYQILQNLGGDIRVQSEPGKGAAFQVYLPAISG